MQMKDLTKNMFADALVEMMKEMPLEKVRVRKLCERCGATSPTFYYYFRDKYELVVWIFLRDIAQVYQNIRPGERKSGMGKIIRMVKRERTFYQKAFTDQSQNSLAEYIQNFIIRYFTEAILHDTGKAPQAEQLMVIKYHTYGIMGMFREWLFEQDMSFEEQYEQLFGRAPDFLKKAFAAYPLTGEMISRLL